MPRKADPSQSGWQEWVEPHPTCDGAKVAVVQVGDVIERAYFRDPGELPAFVGARRLVAQRLGAEIPFWSGTP